MKNIWIQKDSTTRAYGYNDVALCWQRACTKMDDDPQKAGQ